MRSISSATIAAFLSLSWVLPVSSQTAVVFDPPDPTGFYQNTSFTIAGDVGYVPSHDDDVVWSFQLSSGERLDPDGLSYSGQSASSALFAGSRLALPGQFGGIWGILVVDVSDPSNLVEVGVIATGGVVAGQNIVVAADGVIGYIAAFTNDRLYSFSVQSLSLVDPDGLALPANPDRIALAGDRLAMVDTDNGAIMVADVSDPVDLSMLGTIALPQPTTFGSNDNIVFAADGRTGFVSSNERVLHSFDIIDLTLLDPNGVGFGSTANGDNIAIHGQTVACIYSRGLVFVDVSAPNNMVVISDAAFGGTVAPQGAATVAFNTDGSRAAIPVVFPGHYVYTFEVATGAQFSPRFEVDDQPNYLTVYGPDNRVGVVCSVSDSATVWLIEGLLGSASAVDGSASPRWAQYLGPTAPNPFASTTSIEYSIPGGTGARSVLLGVYDVQGRMMRMLANGLHSAGTYAVAWDGTDGAGRPVAGGIYFLHLRVNGESETGRVVRLR
jgi:hypothetical protein